MTSFIKKPIIIEAHQWFKNGDHPNDSCILIENNNGELFLSEGKVVRRYNHPERSWTSVCKHCGLTMEEHGWIDTLEVGNIVCPSDWIITGVESEYYPCKDNIFRRTYDLVK